MTYLFPRSIILVIRQSFDLAMLATNMCLVGELLHHGRRVGDEEKTEVRVVSGETNLIPHIETYQL